MSGRGRVERVLAVVGAATLLVVGFDAVTYAATGSSLILGHVNRASVATTVQNTGKGAALNLVTSNSGYPPITTNAKGLVKNLNAQYLSGLTVAQIEALASRLNGLTAAQIISLGRQCGGVPHNGAMWAIAGSTPGKGCQLPGAYLEHAEIGSSDLTNTNFQGADLTASYFRFTTLNGVDFDGANLTGADLGSTALHGANFAGADLTNANLVSADVTGADFTNANLTGATATPVTDTGAIWNNTICPDGSNSNNHFNTCHSFGI